MRQLGRLPLALRYEEDGMVGGVHIVDSEGPIASGTVDGDGTTWPLNLDPFVVRRDEPTVVFLGHTRQNDSELTVNMGFSNLGDDIENPDALFALSHLSVGKLIVPIGPQ